MKHSRKQSKEYDMKQSREHSVKQSRKHSMTHTQSSPAGALPVTVVAA